MCVNSDIYYIVFTFRPYSMLIILADYYINISSIIHVRLLSGDTERNTYTNEINLAIAPVR